MLAERLFSFSIGRASAAMVIVGSCFLSVSGHANEERPHSRHAAAIVMARAIFRPGAGSIGTRPSGKRGSISFFAGIFRRRKPSGRLLSATFSR